MSNSLFRLEVLQARDSQWLGTISLVQPSGGRRLMAAVMLMAIAVLAVLVFGTYTRRARVAGELVPASGIASIIAPVDAVVEHMRVEEGTIVSKGQPLVMLRMPSAGIAGGDVSVAVAAALARKQRSLTSALHAQERLSALRRESLAAQVDAARQELAALTRQIATRADMVRIARESLARMRALHGDHYVSDLQLTEQEAVVLAHVAEVQELQRSAAATERLLAQLRQSRAALPEEHGIAAAGTDRELAMLDRERVEAEVLGGLVLKSPIDGLVAAQEFKSGQNVSAGQQLLALLPRGSRLEAELLVSSRDIGFVKPGQRVMLRYRAFPYQKFGQYRGHVARVSRSAVKGGGRVGPGDEAGRARYYRVVVRLADQSVLAYGKRELLKPGMELEADVLGEKYRLVDWVLEPLYAVGRGTR